MVGFSRANQSLLDAAAVGDVDLAKAALAAGANPSVSWRRTRKKDNYANSALHIASERDHARVAELLIDAGADVEETNTGGATPLHVAAECGRDEMCIRLLAAGANIESKDHDGETPIHAAAGANNASTVRTLAAAGANPNSKSVIVGWTPLHCAAFFGSEAAAGALIAVGANPDAVSVHGDAPLHVLAESRYGDEATAKVLLAAGANPDAADCDGRTPADLAEQRNKADLAGLLRGYSRVRLERPELEAAASKGGDAVVRKRKI